MADDLKIAIVDYLLQAVEDQTPGMGRRIPGVEGTPSANRVDRLETLVRVPVAHGVRYFRVRVSEPI